MPIHSLNNLLKMFPYFFDKSETSNFYKSQKITNNLLKKIYVDLKDTYESFHLDKRLLVWKEQTEAYNYTMRFISTFKLLKEVKIYCDDDIIYEATYSLSEDESYSYLSKEIIHHYIPVEVRVPIESEDDEDNIEYETIIEYQHEIYPYTHIQEENITIFDYSHESSSENIIPSERYEINVTTYDEYEFQKGFPENDTSKNNIYDYDISLDEIGAENNVPRRQYTTIDESEYTYEEIIDRYNTTDPPFNNQETEDDYHYMKRLITYLIKYHITSLPVLEIWKIYGVEATLTNRDKFILRLFDENIHPPNSEGEFDWIPEPWEHKDFFIDEGNVFGEYFFAEANTVQPIKKQGITFSLKFMNSLAEILYESYFTVDIFLNGELIAEDYTGSQYPVAAELLSDSREGNLFTFHAKKYNEVFKTVNILVKVRGCSDADFYVDSSSDSEIEDGTYENPFHTIEKAIESVNGVYNLIAVFGEIELEYIANIKEDCYIIGCNHAKITNNIDSARFFNIAQEKKVTIQDITLQTPENTVLLDNDIWDNQNRLNLPETLVTPTVDYGVLLSDLNCCTTFMKDIKLVGNKIVFTEISQDELVKLKDTNKLIQNLNLEGNKITFTEYTPITSDEHNQNLPYIHLDDRLELVKAVEKLELQNNTLISTEYGDELAWEIKRNLILNQS